MGPDGPTCPRLLLDLLLMAPLSFPSSHGQFWQLHVFPCHCGGVLTVYLVGTPCNWWPSTLEGVWCSFAPPLEEGLVVVAVSATPLSCCWDSSWLWWWPQWGGGGGPGHSCREETLAASQCRRSSVAPNSQISWRGQYGYFNLVASAKPIKKFPTQLEAP